jgi:ABC-type uncharacterized transport system substrate-binding protein
MNPCCNCTVTQSLALGKAMRRRDFMLLLSGAVAASPTKAAAQQGDRTRRIGVLMGIGENDPEAEPRREALENGFKELGWTGNRIHLDYRWTGGDVDRTWLFAREIVELKPDAIVVHSTPAVKELRQLTSTIPMVFVLIADPLGSGFVASLNHPGGNLTGFMKCRCPNGQQVAGAYQRSRTHDRTSRTHLQSTHVTLPVLSAVV